MTKREINLGDDLGTIIIHANGTTVRIDPDGKAYQKGEVADIKSESAIFAPATKPENRYEIGMCVEGKGIYLGVWEPKDEKANSLGKIFDLYAAPTDLKRKIRNKNLVLNFNEAVRYVAELKDWHGHDGATIDGIGRLIQSVQESPQNLEKWFIPDLEILANYIYPNKNLFFGSAAFWDKEMKFGANYSQPEWYWGLNRKSRGVLNISLRDGRETYDNPGKIKISVRLVRAELRGGGANPNPGLLMK